MKNKLCLREMIFDAIFASLSIVFYVIGPKFSLPIFPSFLQVNFSMIPILFAFLAIGFKDALVVTILRFFIGLMFTQTMGIGEFSDLIIAVIILLFCSFIKKTFKNNLKCIYVSIVIGWVVGGLLSNLFALPMYLYVMNAKDSLISSLNEIFPAVNSSNYVYYYFMCAVLPFNLAISIVVVIMTVLLNIKLKGVQISCNVKQQKSN